MPAPAPDKQIETEERERGASWTSLAGMDRERLSDRRYVIMWERQQIWVSKEEKADLWSEVRKMGANFLQCNQHWISSGTWTSAMSSAPPLILATQQEIQESPYEDIRICLSILLNGVRPSCLSYRLFRIFDQQYSVKWGRTCLYLSLPKCVL